MAAHFLVIGAQRCGTTYLQGLLEAHPNIAMARPSRPEPKVFLTDEVRDRGASWYRQTWFAHATTEAMLGEKSTSYLERPDSAARAAAVLGDVRIVVQLRDPVERAISNWRFSTDNGLERRPLIEALEESLVDARGWDPAATSVSPYAYLERGRYADQLDPWLDTFPGAVHVGMLEDLVAEPGRIGDVYGFLGVDPGIRPAGLDDALNQSEEPAPALPSALVARLRRDFQDSDDRLRSLLGRDLPWSSAHQPGSAGSHR